MRLLKPVLRSGAVRRAVCLLAAQYIRLCYWTSSWQVVGDGPVSALLERREPFLLVIWHGRLLMGPFVWPRGRPIHMLVSLHRDGELIANTMAHFGIDTVRGSSARDGKRRAKGGAGAVRALLRLLRQGDCVGITPDGPRGPRMRVSEGTVVVARLSGVPVIALAPATSRRVVLDSWDRFAVPLPFSRGVYVWSEPVLVPRNADPAALERSRLAIEEAMIRTAAEADRRVGLSPIEPAPVLTPAADCGAA